MGSSSAASTDLTLVSLGHSNRRLPELMDLLHAEGVDCLVDVRRFPRSRRFPHFNGPRLAVVLKEGEIAYHHLPELGAFRKAPEDPTPYAALDARWHGYAAHMGSEVFGEGLESLLALATRHARLALMCAERDSAHCHRQLLADALELKGVAVTHVQEVETRQRHRPHPALSVVQEGLVYPARQTRLFP